jgi:hypothetical protein
MSVTIPGGQERGKTVEEASDRTLQYWADKANRDDVKRACADEIKRRQNGGTRVESAAPVTAPTFSSNEIQKYIGSFTSTDQATKALTQLTSIGHLVSPAPACGAIPEGTAIVITAVMVDPKNETFPISGGDKVGISKVPLLKISSAAGISWRRESGRQDNGGDARFAHYLACGSYRQLDGSIADITGEKVMDLRDGSPQIAAIKDQTESKYKKALAKWENSGRHGQKPEPGNWESQVRDLRLRILEHAETKAKLRAIRSIGIRTSYTIEELRKPFFVVKLQFTGYSDDPTIRQMFAERIADAFLSGSKQLYGSDAQHQSNHAPSHQRYAPPPVHTTHGETLDDEDGEPVDDELPI